MQQNMETIDNNEDISTGYEEPRASYKNMEGLWRSIRPKQPSKRYGYCENIHNLVDYTKHSLKKGLKLFKEKGIQVLHK